MSETNKFSAGFKDIEHRVISVRRIHQLSIIIILCTKKYWETATFLKLWELRIQYWIIFSPNTLNALITCSIDKNYDLTTNKIIVTMQSAVSSQQLAVSSHFQILLVVKRAKFTRFQVPRLNTIKPLKKCRWK